MKTNPTGTEARVCDDPLTPNKHMTCQNCGKAAMFKAWEWSEIDNDKLQCPACFHVVPIGQWIDGPPLKEPEQLCLMCGGVRQ